MSAPPDGPPRGVPTLTEVVSWPDAGMAPSPTPEALPDEPAIAAPVLPTPQASPASLPGESELTALVLEQVQRQVDLMIEQRMREALMPLLARLTDNLVRDARNELASTLRDVVARAVAQELARHRGR